MKSLRTISTLAVLLTLSIGSKASADEQPLSQRDQLRVAAQEICPVSGKKLGSMGTPLKKRVGEETVFLCCKGCEQGKLSREHWGTIHTNIKKAQATCPVMGKPLPAKSKWTIVEGQIVYVCCPPCIEKIEAEPAKWLAKVDRSYAASTNPLSDELKIAAQQICPVSGKKLGSMGTPIKRKIGKQEVFLCCNGCTKGEVNPTHWGSIHANIKKAQAICPVMDKPLPPKSKWTVVDGQIVYVCCPPCTKKIEADSKTYLKKVATSYRKTLGVPTATK